MTTKTTVDMSHANLLYIAGVGVIMLVSLLISNVDALAFSKYFDFAARDRVCAALFMFGGLAGAWAIQRHLLRMKYSWKVPQSQVTIPYLLFFVLSLTAVVIAR